MSKEWRKFITFNRNMKLHLPKALIVALVVGVALPAMAATLTSEDIATPVENGPSYLDVGTENTTDTWEGDLIVGDTDEKSGTVDYVGAFNDSWGFVSPNGGKTNTTITSGLKVKGNLTVQGNGKLVLGGQYKGGASYTGLEATDSIMVTGGSLTATKIKTKDLTVAGGTVSTSTSNCTSGNSYATTGTAKQSYIDSTITLTGGSLSFGYTANVQGIGTGKHRMTSFGAITMNQSGGTMRVYGDADLKAGATFNQNAGADKLVLRDCVYMGGSGTTNFNQYEDKASLVVGRFVTTSGWLTKEQTINFNQIGSGLIHLVHGSNFAKASTININQSGAGTINIGGNYDTSITGALPSRGHALKDSFVSTNTTYNISQTGSGSVHLKEGAAITANSVKVGKEATLKVDGDMTVTGKATIGNSVAVGAKGSLTMLETSAMTVEGELSLHSTSGLNFRVDSDTLDRVDGYLQMGGSTGNLELTGAQVSLELTDLVIEQMAQEATGHGTEYLITLISNINDTDMSELTLMLNDTLVLEELFHEMPATLAESDNLVPITIQSEGLVLENNSLKALVVATNLNLIPEPTTATLSLLALAALTARRRRR